MITMTSRMIMFPIVGYRAVDLCLGLAQLSIEILGNSGVNVMQI